MKGQFFAFPQKTPEGVNIRTGVVKHSVGTEHWLLQFHGPNYNFSNVFTAEQLTKFAFFDTREAQDAFIADLKYQTEQAAQQAAQPSPEDQLTR